MYYYSLTISDSYGDGSSEHTLTHSKKYNKEKFTEIVDKAIKETAKKVMPKKIKKKEEYIAYLRSPERMARYEEDKKRCPRLYESDGIEYNRVASDLPLEHIQNELIDHLKKKYGFALLKYTVIEYCNGDMVVGVVPEVK